MRRPKAPSCSGDAVGLQRAQAARRLEQARGLELAAAQVALQRHGRVPGVGALQQLALGERRRRLGEHADLVGAPVGRQLGEGAGEEQVAGGGGGGAPGRGHHGRDAAAQGGGVEDVVVDEGRGVDELDRGGGAHEALALLAVGGQEDQQRAQALAAGGDRRARVLGQQRAVAGGHLAQALLDALEQVGDVRPPGPHDLRDRPRHRHLDASSPHAER